MALVTGINFGVIPNKKQRFAKVKL